MLSGESHQFSSAHEQCPHLVLVNLLLQDLISVSVNLHLLLLLQLPSQPGQILLEFMRTWRYDYQYE